MQICDLSGGTLQCEHGLFLKKQNKTKSEETSQNHKSVLRNSKIQKKI